ncbi:transposon Tf2-1 polyprotein isoform X1 [Cucumis melo var. makuwa]|uniref:Transposon Tf2-1 polyprotein isoform X1 n=1 Tax=Cucumis melo var. makuwa TaxID=1194695 RepID=A0A5D3CQE9_CUCMM|nr:transposon Tf2-1 polyprotein isoform X1 [Cucumis melo var. makuwa]TYK13775.1 transposon Tf2-1 polyprotein isoform X1 [Cucumis melo var. makuwa]
MAKKVEERFKAVKEEIMNIITELQRLPQLEAKITKHMEKVDLQNEKNQQQQQLILKYIEGMMKEHSSTRESEGSTSKMKAKMEELIDEPNFSKKENEEKVEEYRNHFDKLMEPLSDLQDRVIEETFMNSLLPWIKAEVEFCQPVDQAQMMRLAQLVENREIIRSEANLEGYNGGKYPASSSSIAKSNIVTNSNDSKSNNIFPMRTITLRGTSTKEEKKEGPSKRLTQARKEKSLYFQCNVKYSHDHKCKAREQREIKMDVGRADNEELEIMENMNYEEKELKMVRVAEEDEAIVELSIN